MPSLPGWARWARGAFRCLHEMKILHQLASGQMACARAPAARCQIVRLDLRHQALQERQKSRRLNDLRNSCQHPG